MHGRDHDSHEISCTASRTDAFLFHLVLLEDDERAAFSLVICLSNKQNGAIETDVVTIVKTCERVSFIFCIKMSCARYERTVSRR